MNTVVIAANLGHLKAFRVVETPVRGRKLERIDEVEFPEARNSYQTRMTNLSKRFSTGTDAGVGRGMAYGEALNAQMEVERRLVKLVASRIVTVLETERPEYWYLAATQEIYQAIMNALPPDLRDRVVRHAYADLTKTPATEILAHFTPAWAA